MYYLCVFLLWRIYCGARQKPQKNLQRIIKATMLILPRARRGNTPDTTSIDRQVEQIYIWIWALALSFGSVVRGYMKAIEVASSCNNNILHRKKVPLLVSENIIYFPTRGSQGQKVAFYSSWRSNQEWSSNGINAVFQELVQTTVQTIHSEKL